MLAEMKLADETRASVKEHYTNQIKAARYELSQVDPANALLKSGHDGRVPEPAEADVVRDEKYRLACVRDNPENAVHIRKTAALGVAKGFAELERLTGSPAPFSEQDVEAQFAAEESGQRASPAEVPHFGHQANTSGAFRRRAPTQTTELMSDPTDRALAARHRLHAEQAQQHQYSGRNFGGGQSADSFVPIVSASPTGNLCDNSPVFTKRTHLSGRIPQARQREGSCSCRGRETGAVWRATAE